MTDIKSKAERSRNMAAIKGKDTKPEVFLRKCLFAAGYRYRKNASSILGHPDIWMKKYNTAIFVNGCFWHRHEGCKYAYMPKSRVDFWEKKFSDNVKRDQRVKAVLEAEKIRCIVVWECTVKKMMRSAEVEEIIMQQIQDFLCAEENYLEL